MDRDEEEGIGRSPEPAQKLLKLDEESIQLMTGDAVGLGRNQVVYRVRNAINL